MDNSSRIAMIRYGTAFPDDISNTEVYNLEDHLGSSSVRLDTNGAIIDKEEYYPFGDSSLRTFDKKRYRFTGKEKDSESGLYNFGARYYAAWTCRFISVDPKAKKSDYQSSYAYGDNNPVVMNDPSGNQSKDQVSGTSKNGGDSGDSNNGSGNQQGKNSGSNGEKKKQEFTYATEKDKESSNKNENRIPMDREKNEKSGESGEAETDTHTMKEGQTYNYLSEKYDVSVEQLREWNKFPDRDIPIGAEMAVSKEGFQQLKEEGVIAKRKEAKQDSAKGPSSENENDYKNYKKYNDIRIPEEAKVNEATVSKKEKSYYQQTLEHYRNHPQMTYANELFAIYSLKTLNQLYIYGSGLVTRPRNLSGELVTRGSQEFLDASINSLSLIFDKTMRVANSTFDRVSMIIDIVANYYKNFNKQNKQSENAN
jgi:RHS repeat-associated protein